MNQTRTPTLYRQHYELTGGTTTSVELVRSALREIEASQPHLGAFTTVLADSALAAATDADRRLAAGDTSLLLGIPVAVNDDIDIAGIPTTFGTAAPAPADAEVVRRLRAAGAVIVGKTAAGQLGQLLCTTGPGGAYTQNPWGRGYTPGAACGGAAAAVAAGLIAAAIGTDTGGAVRIAAAWTNLVGIKPAPELIPTAPLRETCNGLTSYGVLARTARDAAAVLDAVADPSGLHQGLDEVPGSLTIGVSTRFPFPGELTSKVHPQSEDATENFCAVLELLGHKVFHGSADYGRRLVWNYAVRTTAGLFEWADRLGGLDVVTDPPTRRNGVIGWALSQAALRKARRRERKAINRVGRVFDHVDLLVTPTVAVPALELEGVSEDPLSPLTMLSACPATWPCNVLGWPALSVPAGFTSGGLPFGVQLIGPPGSEPLLIHLADDFMAVAADSAREPVRWWLGDAN
jgi:amidase